MRPPQLFLGQVMHRRLRPAVNAFVYPVFYVHLPLRNLAAANCGIFSLERANLLSFYQRDHGPRDGSPLLPWVQQLLREHGLPDDGEITLQTFPRVCGIVFNPVSFWFCERRSGDLAAVLAEVSNTFGEHHHYLLAHADGRNIADGEVLERDKVFHVSPFMAVAGHYRFRFRAKAGRADAPAWRLATIDHADAAGDLLHTALSGRARPLASGPLLRAFLGYPLLTLAVVVRIHWQALRLWLKRVPFHSKPEPPLEETTR